LAVSRTRDGVELVDRKPNLAKRREAILDRASLTRDAPHWSRLAPLELGLDESAEIPRDRRALSQRGLTERSPGVVRGGDSRNVVIGPHITFNV
jgi:hypothetical protein